MVSIGEMVWVGACAVVNNNVAIYRDCMIGSGAVVVKDIVKEGNYVGIPARRV